MSQTNTDILYIEDGYFTPDGYYVYTARAQVISGFYIDDDYIEPLYFEGASVFATLVAELTLVEGELKEADAQLTSTALTTVGVAAIRTTSSALSSTITQITVAIRTQQGVVSIQAAATQTAAAVKTASAEISAGALFSPTITVEAVKNMTAVIDCVSSVSADTVATRVFDITLSTIVTQSLQGVYTADAQSTIAGAFTSTAITDVAKEYSSSQSSQFTQTVSVDKLKRATASINATSTVTTSKYFGIGRPRNFSGSFGFDNSIVKFGTHSLEPSGTVRSIDTLFTTTVRPKSTQAFVMEAWVYNTSFSTGANGGFGVGLNRLNSECWIRIVSGGNLEFYSGSSTAQTATGAVSLNAWHHILVVARPYTGSNDVSIYVNGTRVRIANRFDPSYTQGFDYFSIGTGVTYIDDVSFHVGNTLGYDVTDTTVAVPTSARENNFDFTRFLWHMDNSNLDDITILVQASAAMTSNSNVVANCVATKGSSATLSSTSTVTVNAINLAEANADLSAQGFVVSVAGRIQSDVADLDSEFTLNAQAGRIQPGSSQLTAEFVQTADTDVVKVFDVQLASEFTQSAVAQSVIDGVVVVGALFSPAIVVQATKSGDTILTAVTSLTATPNYTVNFASAHTAQATVSATPRVILASQVFVSLLTDDVDDAFASSTTTDNERNVYTLGFVGSGIYTTKFITITKHDPKGNFVYQRVIDRKTGDINKIAKIVCKNEQLYVTYSTIGGPGINFPHNAHVQKLDITAQTVIWSKVLSDYAFSDFDFDDDNIYLLASRKNLSNYAVVKLAKSTGQTAWAKDYDVALHDMSSIVYTDDSVFVAHSFGGPSKIYKYNAANGNYQSSLVFDNATYLEAMALDSNGDIMAAVYYGSTNNVLFKLDSNLNVIWQRSYNVGETIPYHMACDSSGNVYVQTADGGIASFDTDGQGRWLGELSTSDAGIAMQRLQTHNDFLTAGFLHADVNWGVTQLNQSGSPEFHTNLLSPFSGTLDWDIYSISTSASSRTTSSSAAFTSTNTAVNNFTPVADTNTLTAFPVYVTVEFSSVQSAHAASQVQGQRIRRGVVAAAAQATQVTVGTKVAIGNSTMSTQFAHAAIVDVTKTFVSSQTATFAASVDVKRTRDNSAGLLSQTQVTAQPYDFTQAEAAFATTSALQVDVSKFTGNQAALASETAQTIVFTRIRPADIATDSMATQLTVAFRNATGTVLLESAFAQVASAVKQTDVVCELATVFTHTAQAQTTVDYTATITADTTQTTAATKFRPAEANLSTDSTIQTDAVKITDVASALTSEFTHAVVNTRLRDLTSTHTAEFTQNTEGVRVKIFTVSVNSTAQLFVTAFALVRIEAALVSEGFVLAAGDVEHIDAFSTYPIESETRLLKIAQETRLYTIEPETRVNIIKGSVL